ncbi:MAG: hypothetical protein RSG86_06495, partial [Oscillospiraceae bacterium]
GGGDSGGGIGDGKLRGEGELGKLCSVSHIGLSFPFTVVCGGKRLLILLFYRPNAHTVKNTLTLGGTFIRIKE